MVVFGGQQLTGAGLGSTLVFSRPRTVGSACPYNCGTDSADGRMSHPRSDKGDSLTQLFYTLPGGAKPFVRAGS
jgi:hypothetical protein